MENQDFSKIGQEIRDAVNEAIETRDFSSLNSAISHTVDGAVKEVQNRVSYAVKNAQSRMDDGMRGAQDRVNDAINDVRQRVNSGMDRAVRFTAGSSKKAEEKIKKAQMKEQIKTMKNAQADLRKELFGKAPGGAASVLFIVFGSILALGFGIPALISAAIGIAFGAFGIFQRLGLFFFLPLTALSGAMLYHGIQVANRRSRFHNYVKNIGTKTICAIKTLSRAVGKPESFVCDDLEKMIREGLFLQGHIDDEKSCLMVTDETYELYLEAKERTKMAQEERKKEEERRKQEEKENPRVREIMNEGLQYIETIRRVNDELPEPVISEKLDKLEKVIGLIYVRIQRSPEKLDSMKRFTEYYLPTTIKLVNAYREFEKSQMESERIAASKREIEQTLDTINLAFERMLDSLYEEDTMDISSDIQVLQTLLAQEGLTDDGLHSMDDIFEGVSGVRKMP